MVKKVRVPCLLAGVISFSGVVLPESSHASGVCVSSSCTAQIIEFAVMGNRIRVRLDLASNEMTKLTNCTLEDGIYFTLWSTHSLYQETLMTLRSAQLAERQVTIRTIDGSTDCTVNYVRGW